MRLAHITKPYISVPPRTYGAVERIVKILAEAQCCSHDVTLFAPGDARLDSRVKVRSLFSGSMGDKGYDRYLELAQVVHAFHQHVKTPFDVVHAHAVDAAVALGPMLDVPLVFSHHSVPRLETTTLLRLADQDRLVNVFLTRSHRDAFGSWPRSHVIPYGVPLSQFPYVPAPASPPYLAFVGLIAPHKGVRDAVDVSLRSGVPLKIAGKIRDAAYFRDEILSHVDQERISFLGEVDDCQRNDLLGNALATLFPIHWSEPLGLVMLESMAVGTPVIAYGRGSVPEIVCPSAGFVVNGLDEMVDAVAAVACISRHDCRDYVGSNFTVERMTSSYERVYAEVVEQS
jgi:glycosyltransferase involved in cell wall biosynthesis